MSDAEYEPQDNHQHTGQGIRKKKPAPGSTCPALARQILDNLRMERGRELHPPGTFVKHMGNALFYLFPTQKGYLMIVQRLIFIALSCLTHHAGSPRLLQSNCALSWSACPQTRTRAFSVVSPAPAADVCAEYFRKH